MKRRRVIACGNAPTSQTALFTAQDEKGAAPGRLPDGYWRHYSGDEVPLTIRALFQARFGRQPTQVLPVVGGTYAAGPLDYPRER